MVEKFNTLAELVAKLEKMNIREMRGLAREFGIIPRNHCREELVKRIIGTFNGELKPEVRKKSGRPTKQPVLTIRVANGVMMPNYPQIEADNAHESLPREGILEVMSEGFGFVRTNNYSPTAGADYYMPASVISRMFLQSGDKVKVVLHQYPDKNGPTAVYVKEVNDVPCMEVVRTPFETLQPCFPTERIVLDARKEDYALRALSLVAPIGKGQRGLIVAPPKTGKTILLKRIAQAVRKFNPNIKLTVLLIDERPEEVTDFMENVDCEVVYSTFDQTPQNHVRIAELVFANARRRVEQGQDVMVLMDSITRLARAYNQTAEQSGRTLTGGLDISALQEPKRMFGMGRNTKTGGSLTVLATALVDTGSKMDDIIYEEFKGTGNMEIHLNRQLSEKRIFPAIDLNRSGTRREELLLNQEQLEGMYTTRRLLAEEDTVTATENLLQVIRTTENNDQTIETLKILVKNAQAKRKNHK